MEGIKRITSNGGSIHLIVYIPSIRNTPVIGALWRSTARLPEPIRRFYSARSAMIGSTRTARRAGSHAASIATAVTTRNTVTITAGSRGDV